MTEAALTDLVARCASDEVFAAELRDNPGLLDAYDLSAGERATLLNLTADTAAGSAALGTRRSKSSLLFLGATAHHTPEHVDLGSHTASSHINLHESHHSLADHKLAPDKGSGEGAVAHDKGTVEADKGAGGTVEHDKGAGGTVEEGKGSGGGVDEAKQPESDTGLAGGDKGTGEHAAGGAVEHDKGAGGTVEETKGSGGSVDEAKQPESDTGLAGGDKGSTEHAPGALEEQGRHADPGPSVDEAKQGDDGTAGGAPPGDGAAPLFSRISTDGLNLQDLKQAPDTAS